MEENYYIKQNNSNNIKILKSDDIEENIKLDLKQYSQQEIVNAQILTQLEYLTCLQELNSLKGGNL